MRRYQSPTFINIGLDTLHETVADYKANDFKFVQICATTLEESCELLYAFVDPQTKDGSMTGLVVNVPDGTRVPSITDCYPAAFVFENETHDLFGIHIDGINIDFGGEFYRVSMAYPMNPRAAAAEQTEPEREGDNDE